MRAGATLVTSNQVNNVNLKYIVERLNECSNNYTSCCDGCRDLKACVKAFDERCRLEDTTCPYCGEEVPRKKYCSNCRCFLPKKRGKGLGTAGAMKWSRI